MQGEDEDWLKKSRRGKKEERLNSVNALRMWYCIDVSSKLPCFHLHGTLLGGVIEAGPREQFPGPPPPSSIDKFPIIWRTPMGEAEGWQQPTLWGRGQLPSRTYTTLTLDLVTDCLTHNLPKLLNFARNVKVGVNKGTLWSCLHKLMFAGHNSLVSSGIFESNVYPENNI